MRSDSTPSLVYGDYRLADKPGRSSDYGSVTPLTCYEISLLHALQNVEMLTTELEKKPSEDTSAERGESSEPNQTAED